MENKTYRKQLFASALTHNQSILHKLWRQIIAIDVTPNDDKNEVDVKISELLSDKNTKKFRKYNV